MKIDFSFAGLNLNIITQQKRARKMHVLCIMLVKTRGIKYFNVETWMLFAPPLLSKFLATRLDVGHIKYSRGPQSLNAHFLIGNHALANSFL